MSFPDSARRYLVTVCGTLPRLLPRMSGVYGGWYPFTVIRCSTSANKEEFTKVYVNDKNVCVIAKQDGFIDHKQEAFCIHIIHLLLIACASIIDDIGILLSNLNHEFTFF